LVNFEDRSTCFLFGDGAGAVILSSVSEGFGVLASSLHAQGEYSDVLMVKGGGSLHPLTQDSLLLKENTIFMDGKSVFKLAVQVLVPNVVDTLAKCGLLISDICYFIPHQANIRIIEYACEKLNLSSDQILLTLQKYGNTSAASIPITLSENAHRFKKGDIIVLSGFGAGFTWGTNILKWGDVL
jgi:3-oxoacyl-[acyl-carrier-protein] synthase-3